jgi:uncharacterized membrane protein YdjX (TVP38/TMEM64 family)
LSAVAVTRTFASMYCPASQTDGDTSMNAAASLAMLAARLMPGVPATGLHYVAGVAPVGVPAFAAAMVLGALVRTAPYAGLGQGIGWGRSPRS